ncbi:MAG TPA: Uma2 family endonuclease [Tepidisphaeraceae bacterium]|nr:Uma2 family endonuclease [Tepidisphaeraceae bacterium]
MTAAASTSPIPQPAKPIPLLHNGDRLTRAEFERRYRAMPDVNKAELIEGIVYMPSPVRTRRHGEPHVRLGAWLGYYYGRTPGLIAADNSTSRLDEDNAVQPDLLLLLPPHAGGAARIDEDDYISGSPELVCEIAASTVSIDLHAKLNAYRRNGVKEYLVWRTEESGVDWFVLRDGVYVPIPSEGGIIRSTVFPGLWLDPAALLAGDLPKLFELLNTARATPEHAAFVARLKVS